MGQITCKDLVCTRGSFALKVDALKLEYGEKIALLGENGCGKTTLLQTLAGILPADSGEIFYNETERWDKFTSFRRSKQMSYLPQEAGVLFNLTVEELIDLTLDQEQLLTGAKREDVLEAAEMKQYLSRIYYSLSGGEKRRAMLSRVFCRNSDLVLLDEPTAPLDMRHSAQVMKYASNVPSTILAAMHDINLAIRYFERFLLMKNGRILFDKRKDGLTTEILEEIYGIKLKSFGDHFMPDV